ncbi:MAG: alpha/beta hydrolase [Ilumatobacter sp.]|uniref:alpha/beta hydrolase n=1 Tax=Ilumatobacter sp. TaxID=1967498 RepID=UPI0026371A22|nr:alpha/beta hydrolase [Ilumatobacter sp.]MDJ0767529.1 alpha/beta hydrolase [Ilumatobacter sp.]
MSTLGAMVLLAGALVGLPLTWNAAKPVGDPTRRYSPMWLPAMVVAELAPLVLLIHVAVLSLGVAMGGADLAVGRFGRAVLVASALLLVWAIVRGWIGVWRLRRRVVGGVPRGRGRALLTGVPITTPDGVDEHHRVDRPGARPVDVIRASSVRSERPERLFVYVHGGGWTGGEPQRQARDLYHALALDGWVVASVRYPFTPKVSVEHQIETIRDAVRWARAEFLGGPATASTVVIGGGSAGGHLAAMAALTATDEAEQVDACVGIYGVYDMANRNRMRAHWHKIRDEVMLETVDDAGDRYRAVSPLDRIHDESPPMLLVHGTHDTLVPIGEGQQFADALRAAGRSVELVPVYGAQHAFDAVSSITSRTAAAVIRDWLRSTVLVGSYASEDRSGS